MLLEIGIAPLPTRQQRSKATGSTGSTGSTQALPTQALPTQALPIQALPAQALPTQARLVTRLCHSCRRYSEHAKTHLISGKCQVLASQSSSLNARWPVACSAAPLAGAPLTARRGPTQLPATYRSTTPMANMNRVTVPDRGSRIHDAVAVQTMTQPMHAHGEQSSMLCMHIASSWLQGLPSCTTTCSTVCGTLVRLYTYRITTLETAACCARLHLRPHLPFTIGVHLTSCNAGLIFIILIVHECPPPATPTAYLLHFRADGVFALPMAVCIRSWAMLRWKLYVFVSCCLLRHERNAWTECAGGTTYMQAGLNFVRPCVYVRPPNWYWQTAACPSLSPPHPSRNCPTVEVFAPTPSPSNLPRPPRPAVDN